MRKYILQFSLLLAMLCPAVLRANGYVIINQVMYDTPLPETGKGVHLYNGEFIELYNAGTENVSLNGWSIKGDSKTEIWNFTSSAYIPAGGYLYLACRRGDGNNFQLKNLYTESLKDKNLSIIYQNKIILVNDGESLTLCNNYGDTIDYVYYDGTSHKSNPYRLEAKNNDSIPGEQCLSLHRINVEFDKEGRAITQISQWETDLVSFESNRLPFDSYEENYLTDGYSLPNGTNGTSGDNYVLTITPLDPTSRVSIEDGKPSLSSAVRARTSIQYMDGLGRAEETIALGITPDGKDLVSVAEYYGKKQVSRQWLPVEMQTEGQRIDLATIKEQAIADYGDASPFAETKYDKAAHKVEQTRPGKDYQGHPKKEVHGFNAVNEVRNFIVSDMDGSLRLDGY